mmetsp:Transcript_41536/g.102194  ORF Transcript_41536/g.102194 Transcript_41536/m.102194 type:complete len:100 (+) Transcript_41536:111-410(+)
MADTKVIGDLQHAVGLAEQQADVTEEKLQRLVRAVKQDRSAKVTGAINEESVAALEANAAQLEQRVAELEQQKQQRQQPAAAAGGDDIDSLLDQLEGAI